MQKKVPYVAQLGNMDCSIACMTMLFRYYGLDVDIVDVGQVVHIGRDGVNLTQLKQATQQFGFKCTAYRYNKQKNCQRIPLVFAFQIVPGTHGS